MGLDGPVVTSGCRFFYFLDMCVFLLFFHISHMRFCFVPLLPVLLVAISILPPTARLARTYLVSALFLLVRVM